MPYPGRATILTHLARRTQTGRAKTPAKRRIISTWRGMSSAKHVRCRPANAFCRRRPHIDPLRHRAKPPMRFELTTSPLPRECSTTELGWHGHGTPMGCSPAVKLGVCQHLQRVFPVRTVPSPSTDRLSPHGGNVNVGPVGPAGVPPLPGIVVGNTGHSCV